ncbi:MAG: hypothetical protein OER88_12650 [Planctomycetota bacterium]|nr:hypothetical protein [Planctomycetota bacterium]
MRLLAGLLLASLALAEPRLVIQRGHGGAVQAAAFHEGGKWLATGATSVKIWDVATGWLLATLPPPYGRVLGLSWAGDRLVVAQVNGIVRVWDPAAARVLHTTDHDGGGYCDVSVVGDLLASGADMACGVTKLDGTPVRLWKPKTRDRFWSVALSPDGKRLAAAGEKIYIWRVADGTLLESIDERVRLVRWVGGKLLTRNKDGVVRLGREPLADGVSAVAVHGTRIAFTRHDRVTVDGKTFAADAGALAFSADGGMLLSGRLLYDAATGKNLRAFDGPRVAPLRVAGSRLAVHDGNTFRVWDFLADRELAEVPIARQLAFSPDGAHLLVGGTIHDLANGTKRAVEVGGQGAVALGPGGKLIAWRRSDVKVVLSDGRELPGKRYNDILGLAFTPDGKRLLQGGKGDYVAVVDIDSGKILRKGKESAGWVVSLAQRGNKLLCGGPYATATLRDAATMEPLLKLEGHFGSVRGVSFLGERLVTVGGEGTARIWSADGRRLATIHCLPNGGWIAIAPDGRYDASADARRWAAWTDKLAVRPLASVKPTRGLLRKLD